MAKKETLVIILNWNGTSDTLECLKFLRQSSYSDFDTIVVDNGSRPEEKTRLEKSLEEEIFISSKENLGFAGGCNLALDYGLQKNYRYFFLLNNDAQIDPNCLSSLLETAQRDRQIGIVGAVNYYASDPKRVWYSGGVVDWKTGQLIDPTEEVIDLSKFPLLREVDDVAGSSLFVKKEVVDKIGLLEPKYFAYYEETEWCLQAKKEGYKIISCLSAKVFHKISQSLSPSGIQYLMIRNRFLFMLRNAPTFLLLRFLYQQFREGISLWFKRASLDEHQLATLVAYRDVLRRRWSKGQIERFLK